MPEFSLEIDVVDDDDDKLAKSRTTHRSLSYEISSNAFHMNEITGLLIVGIVEFFENFSQFLTRTTSSEFKITHDTMKKNSRSNDILRNLEKGTQRTKCHIEAVEESHVQMRKDLKEINDRVQQIKARRNQWKRMHDATV